MVAVEPILRPPKTLKGDAAAPAIEAVLEAIGATATAAVEAAGPDAVSFCRVPWLARDALEV